VTVTDDQYRRRVDIVVHSFAEACKRYHGVRASRIYPADTTPSVPKPDKYLGCNSDSGSIYVYNHLPEGYTT
jgi:hypothetical protein